MIMEPSGFLDRYSGQSVDELLALENEYRVDSIVLAFEEAVLRKAERIGMDSLSEAERTILAVEALEREVNNGGYDQFFFNSSCQYASIIVEALERIGCPKTAKITQGAIDALDAPDLTVETIERIIQSDDEERREKHGECDEDFYDYEEDLAECLFLFIKKNKETISLEA